MARFGELCRIHSKIYFFLFTYIQANLVRFEYSRQISHKSRDWLGWGQICWLLGETFFWSRKEGEDMLLREDAAWRGDGLATKHSRGRWEGVWFTSIRTTKYHIMMTWCGEAWPPSRPPRASIRAPHWVTAATLAASPRLLLPGYAAHHTYSTKPGQLIHIHPWRYSTFSKAERILDTKEKNSCPKQFWDPTWTEIDVV